MLPPEGAQFASCRRASVSGAPCPDGDVAGPPLAPGEQRSVRDYSGVDVLLGPGGIPQQSSRQQHHVYWAKSGRLATHEDDTVSPPGKADEQDRTSVRHTMVYPDAKEMHRWVKAADDVSFALPSRAKLV